ncbi:acetyltransferase [Xenorhabdus innexi]|uniref:Acetyltransferase n=1 Tax=Xenorhabdus innexi TaxID=290109 RepID=A0A1N6MTK6_9GAMM|nr:acetyltransferase [Xenorhabdus innexi]PHM36853.1 acetyltransferase [Xenorhabdus innexi]SIP72215.1 Acetyltransferase, GNAT family [Xenorhabdus innexi]
MNSIRFEQADVTKTYLIIDQKGIILAYFSLTFKELNTYSFSISKTKIKKLDGISKNANTIKVYLVGQIAKNFAINQNTMKSKIIFTYVKNIIITAKSLIGGRIIALECENNTKLIKLYIANGFEKLPKKEEGEKSSLITMILNS